MKIFISAFEPSAKLYLSRIIQHIEYEPIYSIIKIAKKTIAIYTNEKSLATVGIPPFTEFFKVFLKTFAFLSNIKVDIAILADSPDFNVILGTMLKAINKETKIVFYIPPTVWAWRPQRKELVEKLADKILFIFPFEKNTWSEKGIFTGHPLCNIIEEEKEEWKRWNYTEVLKTTIKKKYALLPGSRISEIKNHKPIADGVVRMLQSSTILIPTEFFDIQNHNAKIFPPHLSRWVMHISDAVICASGTASLEAALLQKPTVVFYKLPKTTFEIAKKLVNVKFVSLPNIILGDEIFPEFIQEDATPTNIVAELKKVENDREKFIKVGEKLYNLLKGLDFKSVAKIMIQ